jgi:RHS repeat-associated protein
MLMTDESAATVWESEYLPFGEAHSVTGSVTNNLRFPGQYFDSETELHYNYFRDYNPVIGRYVEADPIGIKRGENHLFVYVGDNPVNSIDSFGLKKCIELCWMAKGSFSGGLGTSIGHLLGGRPNTLNFDIKCPTSCPYLESTFIVSEGDPPDSPDAHPFPNWGTYDSKTVYSVPTRSIRDTEGLSRVRICGKCCDC